MDIETAAAVERLSDRIDRLALSFRGEMGELRGEVGGLRGEVGGLRGEVGGLRGEVGGLRGELREGLAENRRHTQVLFESLRDDIRILADRFAHISAKIDSQER
jgi:hypothetical protein